MNIKISIVIVSYNQDQFLEATIQSVINQNYKNKEVILIDGGSTDNSLQIIKKYAENFSNWVSEPDKGQTDAIIKGFNKSTGDVISWINSDDLLESGVLDIVASKANNVNSVNGVFYGKSLVIDALGKKRDISVHEKFNYFVSKKIGPCISQPGTFWGREAYFAIGGLNIDFNYCMDKDLFCNFLFSGYPFFYTGEVHASFRRYSTQKGHSLVFLKICDNERMLIDKKYGYDDVSNFLKVITRSIQVLSRIMNGYYFKTLIFRFQERKSFSQFKADYSN